MHTATSRPSTRHTKTSTRTVAVCVVDPEPTGYGHWRAAADQGRLRLHVVTGAEEALRLARSEKIDLWLVNTALPRLSGYELCDMLKSRQAKAAVYLVADHYSTEVEQAAWGARATMFGVKGDQQALLAHWLEQHRDESLLNSASS